MPTMDELDEEDLRKRSAALDEAQTAWEELAYVSTAKAPCPECSGAGQIGGGTLGDICPRCLGQRVIDAPGSEPLEMPPFSHLRAAITAYGDALADRALPAGHRARKQLALPPASSVPALESLVMLKVTAIGKAKQLRGAPGWVDPKLLAEPKKAKGLAGDGELGEYSDAELAELEDAANRGQR
jgi:hypothetical protein